MQPYGLYALALAILLCAAPCAAFAGQETAIVPADAQPHAVNGPPGANPSCIQVTNNSPTRQSLMVPNQILSEFNAFLNTTSITGGQARSTSPAGVSYTSGCGCSGTVNGPGWYEAIGFGANSESYSGAPDNGSPFVVNFPGDPNTQCVNGVTFCMGSWQLQSSSVTLKCTNNHAVIVDAVLPAVYSTVSESDVYNWGGPISKQPYFSISPDGQSIRELYSGCGQPGEENCHKDSPPPVTVTIYTLSQ